MEAALGVSGISQLADILGVDQSTVSTWKRRQVPQKQIEEAAKKSGQTFEEIKYGKQYAVTRRAHRTDTIREVSDEHERLLLLWDALEEGQKKTVMTVIETLAKESRAKDGGGSNSADRKSA